jgi:hypothetical protein
VRHTIAAAVAVLALSFVGAASASTASQREYKRGYADCAAGRWDENQHGVSYKRGCRAAEAKGGSKAKSGAASVDAKVPGTNFHATGDIPCTPAEGVPMASCKFGVVRRGNGDATVTVFLPGGSKRNIIFKKGKAASSDAPDGLTSEKSGDLNRLTIGGAERYEIPDAVIFGG